MCLVVSYQLFDCRAGPFQSRAGHVRARESGCTGSIFQCKKNLEPLHVVVGEVKERDVCKCTTANQRKVLSNGPPAVALGLI